MGHKAWMVWFGLVYALDSPNCICLALLYGDAVFGGLITFFVLGLLLGHLEFCLFRIKVLRMDLHRGMDLHIEN